MLSFFRHDKMSSPARKALALWLSVCLTVMSFSVQATTVESPIDCLLSESAVGSQANTVGLEESACIECQLFTCACQITLSALADRGGPLLSRLDAPEAQLESWKLGPYRAPFLDRPDKPPRI